MSSSTLKSAAESTMNDTRNLILRLIQPSVMVLKAVKLRIEELHEKKKDLLEHLQQSPNQIEDEIVDVHLKQLYIENKIKETSKLLEEVTKELDAIIKIMAKFAAFLKPFSAPSVNDVIEHGFNACIEHEKSKNGETSKLYKNLCKLKTQYLIESVVEQPDINVAESCLNTFMESEKTEHGEKSKLYKNLLKIKDQYLKEEKFKEAVGNDAVEIYLDHVIEKEETKNGAASEFYQYLCKAKADYLQEKRINEASVRNDEDMSPEEFHALIDKLCNLEHYGKRFTDVINLIKFDVPSQPNESGSDGVSSCSSAAQRKPNIFQRIKKTLFSSSKL